MNTKAFWKSRTFWYNLAMALLATGNELLPIVDLLVEDQQETLRSFLLIATIFGNFLLRIVTETRVTLR